MGQDWRMLLGEPGGLLLLLSTSQSVPPARRGSHALGSSSGRLTASLATDVAVLLAPPTSDSALSTDPVFPLLIARDQVFGTHRISQFGPEVSPGILLRPGTLVVSRSLRSFPNQHFDSQSPEGFDLTPFYNFPPARPVQRRQLQRWTVRLSCIIFQLTHRQQRKGAESNRANLVVP